MAEGEAAALKKTDEDMDEAIRIWYKKKFEELWKGLKKTRRGAMIAKTTRKYVAKYFFLAGLATALEVLKDD